MSVKSGQSITVLFSTANSSGVAVDADSTPTGVLYVNGTADAASVVVTNLTTGVYKAAVTLPSLTAGDLVSIRISATISTNVTEQIPWQDITDTARLSDGVNLVQISGDAAAADALELQYDGTGLIGETYPATQVQIASLGVAAGTGLNFEVEADNTGGAIKGISFVGVETSGTYASTEAEDGVEHQIDDTANAIDIVYQIDVGGIRRAVQAVWKGHLSGSNDTISVLAYDYVGATWDSRKVINGQAGTDHVTINISLLSKHTGTGTDQGKVLLRFVCSGQSNPTLYTDELLVEAAIANQSVGYANGAIWIDSSVSNELTTPFVDGVADNPVSTWAAALSLSSSLGLRKFHAAGGTLITFTGDTKRYRIEGYGYFLALGGQDISYTVIERCELITGISSCDDHESMWFDCQVHDVSVGEIDMHRCHITGTVTLVQESVPYLFEQCSWVYNSANTPAIDFVLSDGTKECNVDAMSGVMVIKNMETGDVLKLNGLGHVTIDSSCTGGAVAISPAITLVNNGVQDTLSYEFDYTTLDTNLDSVLEDTGTTLPATLAALNDLSTADISAALVGTSTVSVVSVVSGSKISLYGSDTWDFTVTDTDLALGSYETFAFVVKSSSDDSDDDAQLVVRSDTGLTRIAQAAPADAGNGTLTTPSATSFRVTVSISETSSITSYATYKWWLKAFDTTPTPDEGFTLATGKFVISKPGYQATA